MKTVYLHGFGGSQLGPRKINKGLRAKDPLFFDLPSFGDSEDSSPESITDWSVYANEVIASIDDMIGKKCKFRIIGHSHGAMLAYIIASKLPDRVDSMLLLCPLSSGSKLSRMLFKIINLMCRVVGYEAAVLVMKATVDIVSIVSWQPNWPKGSLKDFINQRRAEAKRYTPTMGKLLLMIPDFTYQYESSIVNTRAVIVLARGDLAVSKDDINWYEQHMPNVVIVKQRVKGGHIMPDMHPVDLANLIRRHNLFNFD